MISISSLVRYIFDFEQNSLPCRRITYAVNWTGRSSWEQAQVRPPTSAALQHVNRSGALGAFPTTPTKTDKSTQTDYSWLHESLGRERFWFFKKTCSLN